MTLQRADIAIVGGGIVGLAAAYRLLEAKPDLRVVILEKEPAIAAHQTGRNSGVVHAGLYYAPGSLKARLCREGKAELEAFAAVHDIPLERPGKLVVARDEAELLRFEALRERAIANGVPDLEVVRPERMRELEPNVVGVLGLWSPSTGIVDYRRVATAIADEIRARGGTIETSREVTGIAERGGELVLATTRGELIVQDAIACAGLHAGQIARMTRDPGRERIVPFRGDYYTLTQAARHLVRGLIYPVPDPRFPFLGVHLTKRIDGEVWAGPNAVLAFAREGYRRRDVSIRDLAGTVTNFGFLRLAARFWRTGAVEMWRDWSKGAFLAELRRFVPELRSEDLVFGPSGVRAQALDPDGTLVDDFRLGGTRHVLHVRNAPSPAATASLAIGRELAARAIERFELA
jgi:(S)-2-hydroxyglutarate dehydrogenase